MKARPLGACLLAVWLGSAAGCAEPPAPVWPAQDLVLADVRVVDTRTGAVTPEQTITIRSRRGCP